MNWLCPSDPLESERFTLRKTTSTHYVMGAYFLVKCLFPLLWKRGKNKQNTPFNYTEFFFFISDKKQDVFLLTVITEAFGVSQLSSHVGYTEVIKQ